MKIVLSAILCIDFLLFVWTSISLFLYIRKNKIRRIEKGIWYKDSTLIGFLGRMLLLITVMLFAIVILGFLPQYLLIYLIIIIVFFAVCSLITIIYANLLNK